MNISNETTDELSDEQFCALLMGGASSADADANALKDAVAAYRTESLQWAERRSAAMPSLATAAKRGTFSAAVPRWSMAAVAVMTIAIGAAHFGNAATESATAESAAAGAPSVARYSDVDVATPQQIAADNALLGSIDAAVNSDAGLPVSALGLNSSSASGHAHGSME